MGVGIAAFQLVAVAIRALALAMVIGELICRFALNWVDRIWGLELLLVTVFGGEGFPDVLAVVHEL